MQSIHNISEVLLLSDTHWLWFSAFKYVKICQAIDLSNGPGCSCCGVESNLINKNVKCKLSQNWLHVPLSSGNRNRNRNGYSGNGSELTFSSCCFVSLTFSSFKGVFVTAISAATAPHARCRRDGKEKDTFDDCKEKETRDEWRDGLLNLHCALVLLNFDNSPVKTAILLAFTTAHALEAILPDFGQQKSGSPSLLSYLI